MSKDNKKSQDKTYEGLVKHCESWFKAIQDDLSSLKNKNFELERKVAALKSEATQHLQRILTLENDSNIQKSADQTRKIDEEAKTLMLTGVPTPKPNEDRIRFLESYLQKQAPSLNRDILSHNPQISFNSLDAKKPTVFLKFDSKKDAFATSKNLKSSKEPLTLRSCIPDNIRRLKEKHFKDFRESNTNDGYICQITIGSGGKKGYLVINRSPDPRKSGKPITWKHFKDVPLQIPQTFPDTKPAEDPPMTELQCTTLNPQTPR